MRDSVEERERKVTRQVVEFNERNARRKFDGMESLLEESKNFNAFQM
jgi:hypothetical protein